MSEIKNGGLDQYGADPFEQQYFGTANVEGVNSHILVTVCLSRTDFHCPRDVATDSSKLS